MLGLLGSAMAGGAQAVSQVSEGRIEEKRAKALEKLRTMNNRAEGAIRFGQEQTLAETNFNNSQQLSEAESRRQDRRDELNRMSAKGLADTKLRREKEIIALKLDEGGPGFGKVQPGDFTPESLQEYGRTKDFNDLVRYESKRVVNIGGVTHMMDPVNGTITPGQITESGFQATGSPISTGQNTTTVTAGLVGANEAQIAGMNEAAKLESQLATKPAVEAAVTTARVTAENQAKSMSPEAQSAERKKITSAQGVIAQIDNLTNSDDYMKAISGVRGKLPPVPGTPGFDAEVAFNQLKDSLTLENLDKMSGVLTDRDIQLLSSAASGLEFGMSRKALEARLSIIKSVLEDQSAAAKGKLERMMGGSVSTGGATGIMNMSADQIQSLNPADLSDQELKQAADRYNQLGGQ